MKDLYTLTDIVKETLEKEQGARNSDSVLYVKVCNTINPAALERPFWDVISNTTKYGLPSVESVCRIRRKIQTEHPWLQSDEKVKKWRSDNEEIYREYAVNYETRSAAH